jgi:hypothetical protein
LPVPSGKVVEVSEVFGAAAGVFVELQIFQGEDVHGYGVA